MLLNFNWTSLAYINRENNSLIDALRGYSKPQDYIRYISTKAEDLMAAENLSDEQIQQLLGNAEHRLRNAQSNALTLPSQKRY